ncbi:hypothetical protein [Pseudomonas sp.]
MTYIFTDLFFTSRNALGGDGHKEAIKPAGGGVEGESLLYEPMNPRVRA